MARLDEVGAVRIAEGARPSLFSEAQLDALWVWLRLAHRDVDDVTTYRLAGGGMLAVDETDDAELHLDADAVAHFMDGGRAAGGSNVVAVW